MTAGIDKELKKANKVKNSCPKNSSWEQFSERDVNFCTGSDLQHCNLHFAIWLKTRKNLSVKETAQMLQLGPNTSFSQRGNFHRDLKGGYMERENECRNHMMGLN